MKANIQAVSLKIQTLKSQNTMAVAMRGVTKAMQNMNKQLNLPQIQKILHVKYQNCLLITFLLIIYINKAKFVIFVGI